MKAPNMDEAHFDLNDIEHEPTDAQLDALMKSVAEEVARRAKIANDAFMQNLRAAIAAVNKSATDAWRWLNNRA